MRRSVFVLAAALSLSVSAEAGWNKMDGQPVPDITAKEWFNAGKKAPSTSSLRGKVLLIEFMATW